MRARHVAVLPALASLALASAGCGGNDAAPTPTPTPTPAVTSQGGSTGTGNAQTGGSGSSSPSSAQTTTPEGAHSKLSTKDSLSTQIAKNPDLRTFSVALNAAGLASTLDDGTYTVFAPNNDAFTKLGSQLDTLLQPGAKSQLRNILKFHIVEGKYKTKQLRDGKLLTTLQGTRLRVTEKAGELLVGNSLGKSVIIIPDAKASNGIIHTVDTVLKPKNAG